MTPKRRWFRFSLRTLLFAVAVVACLVAFPVSWHFQREQWKRWVTDHGGRWDTFAAPDGPSRCMPQKYYDISQSKLARYPSRLRLIGQEPVMTIRVGHRATLDELNRLQSVFPESLVLCGRGEFLQDGAMVSLRASGG
ncbi:MAG: hypothetical protein DWQ37_06560 [Planctomycetota bacterium]|nr:MAG: hypothetical protein DWQ37_06560 [Planctomycetota bacterium]